MAHTAHQTKEAVKEHFETELDVQVKVSALAELVKQSKHVILFTGAGISTSAGIPDFRGPQGVWTLMAAGKSRTEPEIDMLEALPTKTHMAIVELSNRNICKLVVSQNCDGLHRRSGLKRSQIAELHGNTNIELCTKCKKEYLRDFDASSDNEDVHDHETGRLCDNRKCKGKLIDSIINFGENLPEEPLRLAYHHANKADLCIVLGSSLTVSPANKIPKIVGKNAKLVIVNLQKTPYDDLCKLRLFAKTDQVMELLMKKLDVPIPKFYLHRKIRVAVKNFDLEVEGLDEEEAPFSCIKAVLVDNKTVLKKEPFSVPLNKVSSDQVAIKIQFFGHYGEPALDLQFAIASKSHTYSLLYDPSNGEWKAL